MKNITRANACMNIYDRELLYVYLHSTRYTEYFKILLANMKYNFYFVRFENDLKLAR